MPLTVTLVRPPVDVLHKFSKPVECLALGYLGAAVRHAGHDAFLVDGMAADWSVEETARRILATAPDVVGFTVVLNHLPPQVEAIAELLRAGGFDGPVLVGGHAVSFFPERVLRATRAVDAVICGEGELPIQDIVRALADGRPWQDAPGVTSRNGDAIRRNGVKRLDDLELLAHPARDLTADIIDADGLAAMSTSRGCYARCNFCSIPRFYGLERGGKGLASGDWLGRDPASMAAEVLDLHERFGLLELLIVDDEFFGGDPAGVERALRFADLLAAARSPVALALSFRAENAEPELLARLRAGGLRHCFIGLESGVDSDLKLYGKAHSAEQNRRAVQVVKDLGLSFQPGFMMFHYDSTIDQLRRNMAFLRDIGECKPVTVNSSVDPHFGTPLLRVMRRENVVDDHGTSMTMRYKDPRVAVAKSIAEEAALGFQEFMNVIAGIQSAITYEWRRPVPGRRPDVQATIDGFEARVNDGFVTVVEEALQALDGPADPRDVQEAARERLASVRRELSVGRSLLMLFLQQREGGVAYRTQRDLMAAQGVAP
ncbi:radical SAM protein [Micromonospora sp. NPDC007271]|uniref:B12-binding domain-containing radical SAM protein n=1 Tax=Micromonospora sp. NPDC007271 TaxID=3154587 RepID=UPI0033FE3A8F